ncbi:helix-turn-helix domain-containing protein [Cohnella sp.]|uniref:helix-turn-helix domain-containing protein n=1 Tax=Cohnella sp. TaxID=1883426 RepID=UPI003565BBA9
MGVAKTREERFGIIQFGFEWDTIDYTERKIVYEGQTVIYYQFVTDGTSNPIRVVPDGCIDLLFCCDEVQPSAKVCGTVLQGKGVLFYPKTVYFGVRLSTRLSLLLPGLPLKEVIGVQAPFEDTLVQYAGMCEKIAEGAGFAERIACFERDCLPLVTGDVRSIGIVDYCLTEMHRTSGGVSIRELAEGSGYSERYLRTMFKQSLGMSPKLYNRIIRFQRALDGIVRGGAPLTEVAIERGYFDQAHFMKDFKAFSQLTPVQLRTRIPKFDTQ